MPDSHANLAYSTVATAPTPADTGTSLVVAAGEGARFPATPFNATVWPVSTIPTPANAEIVRVTAIATDTLTITRAQESTTARSIVVGDQIAATVTAKTLTDIETDVSNVTSAVSTLSNAVSIISAQVSVLSQGQSVLSQQVSVLSQTVSVHSQRFSTMRGGTAGQVLKKIDGTDFNWNWSADQTGGAGSVDVTSQHFSVLSQAISVLSGQVSVLSLRTYSSQLTAAASVSGLISTDNRISNAVSVVSQAVSVVSTAASNALSVANAASNAASIVSQAVSVVSTAASNALSVANAASNAASVVSQAVSVLSQAVSVAQAALSVRIDTQSQGLSVLSQQLSVLSQALSVLSAGQWSIHSQQISVLSQQVSVLSQAHSVLSQAFSALSAGQWSIHSQQISVLSQQVSVLSQAHSVVSARVSAGVGASAQTRSRNAASVISGATLLDIVSMSVSCQAGLNIIQGGLIFETSTSGGCAFGVSTPALRAQGSYVAMYITSVVGQNTAQPTGVAVMTAVAAGQTAVASVSIATIASPRYLGIEALINASAAGSFQLMGRTSAAANDLIVRAGYLRVFQL